MKLLSSTLLILSLGSTTATWANTETRVGPNATISFATNAVTLSAGDKSQLKELVKSAQKHGKISEVQVAVWSDNPAPREGEKLSAADRELAEKRAKSVETYLNKSLKVGKVEVYNMADRASWLARKFDTTDAELKAEIGRGGDRPMSKDEFQVFKDHGEASKAVVLAITK